MAEEVVEAQPAKSGGKGLMIVLIALILFLLLAVIGGGYFLYSQGVFSPQESSPQAETMKKEESNSSDRYKAAINDLVLNITNAKGREKLMKLSFTLKSSDPTIEAVVEAYKAEIVDVVISQISARSSEELLTVGGKALLKDEMIDEINKVLNDASAGNSEIQKSSIKDILFTTFVIK